MDFVEFSKIITINVKKIDSICNINQHKADCYKIEDIIIDNKTLYQTHEILEHAFDNNKVEVIVYSIMPIRHEDSTKLNCDAWYGVHNHLSIDKDKFTKSKDKCKNLITNFIRECKYEITDKSTFKFAYLEKIGNPNNKIYNPLPYNESYHFNYGENIMNFLPLTTCGRSIFDLDKYKEALKKNGITELNKMLIVSPIIDDFKQKSILKILLFILSILLVNRLLLHIIFLSGNFWHHLTASKNVTPYSRFSELATSIENKGDEYFKHGSEVQNNPNDNLSADNESKYKKALWKYQESLEIRLKIFDYEHTDVGNSYSKIAHTYYFLKNYKKSLKYNLKFLEIKKKLSPEKSLSEILKETGGKIPFIMAESFYALNDLENAFIYYVHTANIRKHRLGQDDEKTKLAVSKAKKVSELLNKNDDLPDWIKN